MTRDENPIWQLLRGFVSAKDWRNAGTLLYAIECNAGGDGMMDNALNEFYSNATTFAQFQAALKADLKAELGITITTDVDNDDLYDLVPDQDMDRANAIFLQHALVHDLTCQTLDEIIDDLLVYLGISDDDPGWPDLINGIMTDFVDLGGTK